MAYFKVARTKVTDYKAVIQVFQDLCKAEDPVEQGEELLCYAPGCLRMVISDALAPERLAWFFEPITLQIEATKG